MKTQNTPLNRWNYDDTSFSDLGSYNEDSKLWYEQRGTKLHNWAMERVWWECEEIKRITLWELEKTLLIYM